MNNNVYVQVVTDQQGTTDYKFNLNAKNLKAFVLWMDAITEATK